MPVAFSYTPSESAESFTFFFDCMRTEFYYDGVCEPAVVIVDHSSGIISAYDTDKALPQSKLQICTWHVQTAMIRWLGDHQYTREDIDGDEHKGLAGLRQLIKNYVYSYTFDELETNRTLLINSLQPEDRHYIVDNWQMKESRLVVAYTKQYTNLGCRASQTVESQNRLIHQVTHGHMSIAASAAGIADWNRDFYNEMTEEEHCSMTEKAVRIDRHAFKLLTGTVSSYAISLIDEQWTKLKRLAGDGENIESRPCRCVMRQQWLLPCYHDLWKAYETGIPLPRSLVHPRYWLAGHVHRPREWAPSYESITQLIISPKRARLESALQKLVQLRDGFDGEERSRFEQQLLALAGKGETIASNRRAIAAIPISAPEALPNRRAIGRREATRTGRLLTALEQQARDSQRVQREANAQARDEMVLSQRQLTQGTIVVNVDQGNTQLTVLVSSSSGANSEASDEETIVEQSRSQSEPLVLQQRPPSTAPPGIAGEVSSKRRRVQTGYYAAVMDDDSQEIKRRR